jgi:hypothetical protein
MERKKIISLQSELAEIEKAEGLDTKWKREIAEQVERCKNATDDEPETLARQWGSDLKGDPFTRERVAALIGFALEVHRKINALPRGGEARKLFLQVLDGGEAPSWYTRDWGT